MDEKDTCVQEMKLILKSLKMKIEIGTDKVNMNVYIFVNSVQLTSNVLL